MSSQSKWEGAAFLINTIVTGSQNYVVNDRWKLSRDHHTLTIRRQIQHTGGAETEGALVYHNQLPGPANPDQPAGQRPPPDAANPPATATPPPPAEIVVHAGTKIPLTLINSLSTKHSSEGDRVYLQTSFPIFIDGRIVIPRGSYVTGTVTEAKRPGKVKGKGEIFLRFDSLTLPNGTTRDFRSRLGGTDADTGQFDRVEGKIKGDGGKGGDARTVATTTGAGASVGAIAGSAAGHGAMGAGIGAAAGAAAGLAAVMLSRGPDLVLPRGTSFEMVLDRDVRYKPAELP
jgi:type IV secretion system protein VirB10